MPEWVIAGAGGLVAAATLLVGALVAWFLRVPATVIAAIMAFGAGVLIATLAYSLVEEANDSGGLVATGAGFLAGATLYTVADWLVSRRGAASRHRSAGGNAGSSGTAIAIGALIDGVPESVALGLTVAGGGSLSLPVLVAIAISNVPEGLSSTAGLKADGRSVRYVFGMWGGIAAASGLAALVGFLLLASAPAPPRDRVRRDGRRGRHPGHGREHDDPGGLPARPGAHRHHHRARVPHRLRVA